MNQFFFFLTLKKNKKKKKMLSNSQLESLKEIMSKNTIVKNPFSINCIEFYYFDVKKKILF